MSIAGNHMAKQAEDENFGRYTSYLYYLFSRSFPSMKKFYSFILSDLSKRHFSSLLDIGSGPGILDAAIASSRPRAQVYGIDPSPYMVRIARSRYGNAKNLHFSTGRNTSIRPKRHFDTIITTLSFHHWAVKRDALEYISGYLARNGAMIIYEFVKPENKLILEGSHSLSVREAKGYSDMKGLKLQSVKVRGQYIVVEFRKRN